MEALCKKKCDCDCREMREIPQGALDLLSGIKEQSRNYFPDRAERREPSGGAKPEGSRHSATFKNGVYCGTVPKRSEANLLNQLLVVYFSRNKRS
jgi:hypothetical protein